MRDDRDSIRALGEVGLIARFARGLRRPPSVRVGIGDDAAVLSLPAPPHALLRKAKQRGQAGDSGGSLLLFASDMIVEGVHFRRRRVPAPRIGWKALAVNVSDIAAMGGVPRWAVVSLGLPPSTPIRFIDGLYAGLARCARRYGMAIVGGDTVRAPKVVIDVAILGTVQPRHLALRSGARVGDILYVTGRLGGSYRSGRHARCVPRLHEAQALVKRLTVHAMIDLSDGLASDLWQMSRASKMVLRVEEARIPVARAAGNTYHALMDGEDFELLFAVSAREAARVPARIGRCPVTRIGAVARRGVGVELVPSSGGRIRRLAPEGFRHF